MVKRFFLILLLGYSYLMAESLPLYVDYAPLRLNENRATTAYYLPINSGDTATFNLSPLTSQLVFASGNIPAQILLYRVLSLGCTGGNKTVTLTIRYNIGGNFVTVASQTRTFNLNGGTFLSYTFDNLNASQQYTLGAGDYVQLQVTANSGNLCLINEYPLGGSDDDISKIELQTAPDFTISKNSCVLTDPVNGMTNPKRIPGATIRYAVQVTNTGNGTGSDVLVTDALNASFNSGTIKNLQIQNGLCNCLGVSSASNNGSNGSSNGVNPVILDFGSVASGTPSSPTRECGYFEVDIN